MVDEYKNVIYIDNFRQTNNSMVKETKKTCQTVNANNRQESSNASSTSSRKYAAFDGEKRN